MDELGDVAAEPAKPEFDDFVVASGDRLFRTAYLLTRDYGRAEDLVQTTLSKTWSAWRRIDRSPWPYAQKVLFNTYATWWRRKWHVELPTETPPEVGEPAATESHAERTDLAAAVGRLPRRQRAVIVLRYYEDLTEKETADILGCSIGNVKSQANRAIAKLRIDPALLEQDATGRGGNR